MTNDNKSTLRLAMRLLIQAKTCLKLYDFKKAEESLAGADSELQRLAKAEKMNTIE